MGRHGRLAEAGRVAAATALVLSTSCSTFLNWDGYSGGDDGGATQDGTLPDALASDGGADAKGDRGVGVDAGNGDGGIGEAGPACGPAGYTCTPFAVPTGWQFVAFNPSARTGCGSDYQSTSTDEGPDGGGACTCACGAANQPGQICEKGGQLSVTLFPDNASCDAGQGCGPVQLTGNGACNQLLNQLPNCGDVVGNGTPPLAKTGGACADNPTVPAVSFASQGELCTPQKTLDCAGGALCVPPTTDKPCVTAQGAVQCPPAFPDRHVVSDDPPMLNDSRTCLGSCGCAVTSAVCSGTLDLYSSFNCNAQPVTLQVDGTCQPFSGDPTHSFTYDYVANPASNVVCMPSQTSQIVGQVAFSNPLTVCCQ
jgi:hypothetical protein